MKQKILIADDVIELAKAVKQILENNGYNVDIAYNGKEAVDKVTNNLYDCIILDIMMPIMDGLEAVKQIRNLNVKTPIILLTAKDLVDDKVNGLDSGANDYLTKPFDSNELLARIRALIRVNEEKNKIYKIGNVIFDKKNSQISKDNILYNLNNKECEVMEYLINNKEKNIEEKELKQKIWMNIENFDNVVPMYIEYIQSKLIALDANIRIENKEGYCLRKIK